MFARQHTYLRLVMLQTAFAEQWSQVVASLHVCDVCKLEDAA